MPWEVDTSVPILYMRKGRLWEVKGQAEVMHVVPGRTQESKTQGFLILL